MSRRRYTLWKDTRGKWRAQVDLGTDPATGRRKRTGRTFTSERAAARWGREAAHRGGTPETGIKVGALLERWLQEQWYRHDVAGELSTNTYSWYRSAIERHIANTPLAAIRADHLESDHVAEFLTSKAANGRLDGRGGLSGTSLRRLWLVLNAAYSWAVARGWLMSNPVAGLDAPRPNAARPDEKAWSARQLRDFMDVAAGHRFEPAFRLQAVTGCRRGELLGLRWSDVELPDIGDASVTFRQSLVVVEGGAILKGLKTQKSVRRIPIDPDTAASLGAWRSAQAVEAGEWGAGWTDTGLVFTRQDGHLIRPDYYTREFKRTAGAAGIENGTPHQLRHTAATLMLRHGVATPVVAGLLGHSSVRVTADVYQATVEELGREAVTGVGAVLSD